MKEVHAVATYGDMLRLLAQRLEAKYDADDAYLAAPDGSAEEVRARWAMARAIDGYYVVADAISQLFGVDEAAARDDARAMLAAWEAEKGGDGDA